MATQATASRTATDMVTGAFSHTGRYIARRLLGGGRQVETLTGHPERGADLQGRVAAFPFSFDDPGRLAGLLKGVDTLYNTYWIRFERDGLTYETAERNIRRLLYAAVEAGVRKIVHVSVANAGGSSGLRYYSAKARVERAIVESGLRYSILRPTVLFGPEALLMNNIAWMLRRFPVFAVPGSGQYRVQPVFVEDLADMAVECGASDDNCVQDAAGPEIFTYAGLVRAIGRAIGRPRPLLRLPPSLIRLAARGIGRRVHDVVLTREEVQGLMAGLLVSRSPALCRTRFTAWLERNKDSLGERYRSELGAHYPPGDGQ